MIHVSFQIHDEDGTYCKYLKIALISLFHATSEKIVIHLLCDETLKDSVRDELRELIRIYDEEIFFYDIKIDSAFMEVDRYHRWYYSVGTFFRLYLPDYISLDIDKIMCLDSDIIFNMDIKELWMIPFDGNDVIAVKSKHIQYVSHPLLEKKILEKDKYFNAGVMVLNMKSIRTANIRKDGIDFLRKYYEDAVCADQDVFNHLFQSKCKYVNEKFNLSVNVLRCNKIYEIHKANYHYINTAYGSGRFDIYDQLYFKTLFDIPFFDKDFYLKTILFLLRENRNLEFKFINNICKIIKKRKIVIFGAKSLINKRLAPYLEFDKLAFFLDNNSSLWDKYVEGVLVKNPNILKGNTTLDNIFIIVSSCKYEEIKKQLVDYGLIEYEHFIWGEYLLSFYEGHEKKSFFRDVDSMPINVLLDKLV